MPDLDQLRDASALISQPSLDDIVRTARRRRRRSVLAATGLIGAVVLAVGAAAVLTPPPEEPAPASPAEKVVRAPSSLLVAAAVSVDDPEVRIALWESACPECAEPGGDATPTAVLALTDDGFATTRHVPSPLPAERVVRQVGEIFGPRIESVGGDRFLVIDVSSPREWLVGVDGEVSPVRRVSTRLAPADRRLWFRCSPGEWTSPRDAGWPDPATGGHPWCALDPSSVTAYEWPARWNGSVEPPVATGDAWGIDNRNQPTFAWWEADGERHRRFLADNPPDARGVVWGPPGGRPTFFVHEEYSPAVEIVLPAGSGTRVVERSAPFHPLSSDFDLLVAAPDGALLAVRSRPEVMIWRAESLTRGDFVLVHSTPPEQATLPTQTGWLHEPTVGEGRIHIPTPTGAIVSDDDGRTWTAITTWR